MLRWWHYRQNNSGGSFTGPAINVYVQAETRKQANKLAKEQGLYWHGCQKGKDCSCCGDRWTKKEKDWDTCTEDPRYYEADLVLPTSDPKMSRGHYLHLLVYADGTTKPGAVVEEES